MLSCCAETWFNWTSAKQGACSTAVTLESNGQTQHLTPCAIPIQIANIPRLRTDHRPNDRRQSRGSFVAPNRCDGRQQPRNDSPPVPWSV